jgi:peptide deformylase
MTTKDDIIRLPNEHLRQQSQKIGSIDESVKKLVQSMSEATLDWEDSREHEVGVALAAIQIDQPLRIVIIRNNFDNKQDRSFQVFINPEITKLEGEVVEDYEGCLSITDIYGKVPRHNKVRIKAMNMDGKEVRFKAEGFLARIFQHEIDHTNGIVFIDHIKKSKQAFYKLNDKGQLEELDYDKQIRNNHLLW